MTIKINTKQIEPRKVISSMVVGVLLAAGPFLFWRIFLQQLPITGFGEATLSERFEEQESPGPTSIPEGQARLRELLAYPAVSLALDPATGMLRMHEEGTGRAFEVSPNTLKVRTLSDKRLDNFEQTIWSPNGTEVISLFSEKERSVYRYFDYQSRRVAELPIDITTLAFSPDGSHIVMVRDMAGRTQIWISAPDGTQEWLLMATRMTIVDIAWPRSDTIALTSRRKDGTNDLVFVDLEGSLEILIEKRPDLGVLWARGGVQALISFQNTDDETVLHVLDTDSGEESKLPLATRASKCIWHRNATSITCGIHPQTSSQGRDTVTTLRMGDRSTVVRYSAPKDIWVGIENPVALPRDNGIAFINLFDKRPYQLTW